MTASDLEALEHRDVYLLIRNDEDESEHQGQEGQEGLDDRGIGGGQNPAGAAAAGGSGGRFGEIGGLGDGKQGRPFAVTADSKGEIGTGEASAPVALGFVDAGLAMSIAKTFWLPGDYQRW